MLNELNWYSILKNKANTQTTNIVFHLELFNLLRVLEVHGTGFIRMNFFNDNLLKLRLDQVHAANKSYQKPVSK